VLTARTSSPTGCSSSANGTCGRSWPGTRPITTGGDPTAAASSARPGPITRSQTSPRSESGGGRSWWSDQRIRASRVKGQVRSSGRVPEPHRLAAAWSRARRIGGDGVCPPRDAAVSARQRPARGAWASPRASGPRAPCPSRARPCTVEGKKFAGQRENVPRMDPLRSGLSAAATQALKYLLGVRSYRDRNRTRADPKPTFASDGAC
jgi:hypothetical protein